MDSPERNAADLERPPETTAHKERETRDDGRYIIFYSFGHNEDEGDGENAGEERP